MVQIGTVLQFTFKDTNYKLTQYKLPVNTKSEVFFALNYLLSGQFQLITVVFCDFLDFLKIEYNIQDGSEIIDTKIYSTFKTSI